MARFNLDISEKTKSHLFIRAKKAGISMKEYLLKMAGLLQYETSKK